MYKNRLVISISVLCMLLASCSVRNISITRSETTQDPNLYDRSWLSGIPCDAPCWYGLQPGISTKKDLIATLQKLPFVTPNTMVEEASSRWNDTDKLWVPVQVIKVDCVEPPFTCLYFEFEEDILTLFKLSPNYDITFSQVVSNLGAPEGITYARKNPEGKGCFVSLLWVKRQVVVTHVEDDHIFGDDLCDTISKSENKMVSELLVYDVTYMPKERLLEYFEKSAGWEGFIDSH